MQASSVQDERLPDEEENGPDPRLPGHGGPSWANGHACMPIGTRRYTRGGRRIPGHVSGAFSQVRHDPAGQRSGPLALRSCLQDSGTGSPAVASSAGTRAAIHGIPGSRPMRPGMGARRVPAGSRGAGALPDNYRAPLILCYFEGLTHEEAATHRGWASGTVKVRLVRGRKLLRERLDRRKIALGAEFFCSGTGRFPQVRRINWWNQPFKPLSEIACPHRAPAKGSFPGSSVHLDSRARRMARSSLWPVSFSFHWPFSGEFSRAWPWDNSPPPH